MWIKIDIVESEADILCLPKEMAKTIAGSVFVYFGKKKVLAKVEVLENITVIDDSFNNPVTIKISKKLVGELLIVESLTYQLILDKGNIVIGPVIALLLGNNNHLYNPDYMEKYSDRFGVYSKFGGLIYAFSYKSIDWDNNIVYGLYYDNRKSRWVYGRFPLPAVIYRRNFHIDERLIKKLINVTDGKLFNSTRFTKYELYKFIEKNKRLVNNIIPTELVVNVAGVKKFLKRYRKIILKPTDSSRGRGICIIEKNNWGYKILDYRSKECIEKHMDKDDLDIFLKTNEDFFDDYLVQKYIDLARVDDSCFDVRVVMQKGSDKVWRCTGTECRVAKKNNLITNISRGGYALPLSTTLAKAFPNYSDRKLLTRRLSKLCKRFCNYMEKMGEHFAEFGIDAAFDRNKSLWLIEANVFPSFKGFKVMDYNNYLNIRYTPLIYAVSLTEFYESVNLKGDKMNKFFTINENKNDKSTLTINAKTAEILNILHKKLGYLSFGDRKCYVYINQSEEVKDNEILISKNLIDYLYLPSYPYYEVRIRENQIILGPFVGILTCKEETKLTKKRLKNMLNYITEYKSINGAVVIFALDGVDTKMGLVKGYCYNPHNESWEKGVFPYPSAIYRRIGLNDFWKNHFLTHIGNKIFNSYYFNKWEMYKWLSGDKKLAGHLPYTVEYEGYKDVINMLMKYKRILVKPAAGMQGKGVFLISYDNDEFSFYFREDSENREIVLNDISDAVEFINKSFIFRQYIVQEYIDLLKYDGRVIDFRVIVQKNENNIWICNGIVGRIGEKKSIVSNISSSGTAVKVSELFKDIFKVSEAELSLVEKSLAAFAIKVCESIDKCGVNCGTVGIDVGIDINSRMWLIEANTRDPDPTIALDINDKSMYLKIKSAPLFYGKYLSGFGSK